MAGTWYNNAAKEIFDMGKKKIKSNEAINTAFDFVAGSGRDVYDVGRRALNSESLFSSKESKGILEDIYKNADNSWNVGRIAGSYVVGSAGVRMATGGGLYKDGHGNNDIIGIPGI